MSRIPQDRKIRIVTAEEVKQKAGYFAQFEKNDNEGSEPISENLVTKEERDRILKAYLQEPSFESKKKKELEILLKTPVFSEAIIRFRMPDAGYIEAVFSPMEKISDLRKIISHVSLKLTKVYLSYCSLGSYKSR